MVQALAVRTESVLKILIYLKNTGIEKQRNNNNNNNNKNK